MSAHKILSFVLVTFFMLISNAQVVVKGVIKDTKEIPLSYTNVIATPKSTNINLTFAISDEEGRYKLELVKNEEYTISISYMGYQSFSYKFTAIKDLQKNFTLIEAKNQLDEVVIELPVTVKEDTITYNTSKFTNGKERKLKNILKKLPGMEVSKDGKVTVMGKKVTTLLVDDKPFFGGNTKLGVENIPADAVDKVQAIDNYNEVAFLKNVSNSDKMALNIKLKEDKKRFVFGDVEAGKGNKNFYKAQANLFYYAPKTNVNFIGNLNNIGEKTFTFKDYLSFQGGINSVFSGNFNWRGGDFSQFLENKDILKTQHRFAAVNITQAVSSTLDVSGYGIFSHTNNDSFVRQQNHYTTFTEDKENTTEQKNTLGIGKITLDYTPNTNEQWYFKTQIKQTDNTKNNNIESIIDAKINNILTRREADASYVNQSIEWHQKSSQKHTFSALVNYTFDKNTPNTFWQMNNPILQGLIPLITLHKKYRIQQLQNSKQHHINTTFKHFWVLNRNNHIYTTLGNEYQKQQFTTNDFQILDNNTQNNFLNDGFNNELNYTFYDIFLGVHYKFRSGIFTFKQGANIHYYNWVVSQQNTTDKNKWVILPDFNAEIKFNNSKKIKLNYALKTNLSKASKLANRYYLQSYNSVFRGNENIENELYHSAHIYYNRFSLYKGLMLLLNANYTKKVKGYRSAVNFDGINRYLTYELIHNPSENLRFAINLRKKIKNIRYKLSGDYTRATFLQNLNNKYVTNKNNNYSFKIGLETLFEKFPTIDVGYERSIGKYTSSNSTSKFTTDEPYIEIEYDFLNNFKYNFEYTFYKYQNKFQGLKNNYQLAETSLLYQKEDSPFTFKIIAKNLFNTQFKQSNSFSDYLISDKQIYIMPRVFMFSLGYKL